MTLGRTTAGAIKIKTDTPKGLRAVSCGCCGNCDNKFSCISFCGQLLCESKLSAISYNFNISSNNYNNTLSGIIAKNDNFCTKFFDSFSYTEIYENIPDPDPDSQAGYIPQSARIEFFFILSKQRISDLGKPLTSSEIQELLLQDLYLGEYLKAKPCKYVLEMVWRRNGMRYGTEYNYSSSDSIVISDLLNTYTLSVNSPDDTFVATVIFS